MMRVVQDEDCPSCGWPETYAEGDDFPSVLGCNKCGWREVIVPPQVHNPSTTPSPKESA